METSALDRFLGILARLTRRFRVWRGRRFPVAAATLDALLTPPGQRPRTFYRGSPRYGPVRPGFAGGSGWRFATAPAGNRNAGHAWGTALAEPDRRALLEYPRTL
jgi:hypothetical protein